MNIKHGIREGRRFSCDTIIGQRQALEDQVRAGAVEVDWPEVGLPAQS